MPYRRLPKTDQARLHALQKAVQQAGNAAYNDQAINYRTLTEAQEQRQEQAAPAMEQEQPQEMEQRRSPMNGEIDIEI